MQLQNKKITIARNIYKNKILRTLFFENSLIWKTLWLFGAHYLSASEKVTALKIIRWKNNAKHLLIS